MFHIFLTFWRNANFPEPSGMHFFTGTQYRFYNALLCGTPSCWPWRRLTEKLSTEYHKLYFHCYHLLKYLLDHHHNKHLFMHISSPEKNDWSVRSLKYCFICILQAWNYIMAVRLNPFFSKCVRTFPISSHHKQPSLKAVKVTDLEPNGYFPSSIPLWYSHPSTPLLSHFNWPWIHVTHQH